MRLWQVVTPTSPDCFIGWAGPIRPKRMNAWPRRVASRTRHCRSRSGRLQLVPAPDDYGRLATHTMPREMNRDGEEMNGTQLVLRFHIHFVQFRTAFPADR